MGGGLSKAFGASLPCLHSQWCEYMTETVVNARRVHLWQEGNANLDAWSGCSGQDQLSPGFAELGGL